MDKKSIHRASLDKALGELKKQVSPKNFEIFHSFVDCYFEALLNSEEAIKNIEFFLKLVRPQFTTPYEFEPYHQKIRSPVDYYRFANDFIRPLINPTHSKILGLENVERIRDELKKGENVVLLANHQTETDPQAIGVLLEEKFSEISESIIYVAGERVVTDPVAIPFSMGCDLLCIYSKRYIDHPPELKAEKLLHNKKTMSLMSSLLKEGGKIIYVAPSGGRDRRNSKGVVEVAPFDPDSIEMFSLMARKSKTPTHFYPLTLATYDLLPPPETIQKELGEKRAAKRTSIYLSFLPEFDMESFPGSDEKDKIQRRINRAHTIWSSVDSEYKHLSRLL